MISVAVILSSLLTTTLAAPISLSIDSSFAANVVMTSGSAQFAVWVPTDGQAYGTGSLSCLNVGASSVGACNVASIDQVGVLNGYTCAFSGSTGWSGWQTGSSGTGWLSVAPPQTIVAIACTN